MSFHDRIFLLMKKGKIVYVNDITAHCQKLEESSVIAVIKQKSILLIPVCCLNHVITINPHFLKDILLQYSNTCEGLLGGAHNTRRMDYIIYTYEGRTYNSFLDKKKKTVYIWFIAYTALFHGWWVRYQADFLNTSSQMLSWCSWLQYAIFYSRARQIIFIAACPFYLINVLTEEHLPWLLNSLIGEGGCAQSFQFLYYDNPQSYP